MIVTMLPGSPAAGTSVPDATGGQSTPSGPFGQLLAALSGHPAPSAAAGGPLADAEASVADLSGHESPVAAESEADTSGTPGRAASTTAESTSAAQLSKAETTLVADPTQVVSQDAVLIAAKILLSHPRPALMVDDRAGDHVGVGGTGTDASTDTGNVQIELSSEVRPDPGSTGSLSTLVGRQLPSMHEAAVRPQHLATAAPHLAAGTAAGPTGDEQHQTGPDVSARDIGGISPAAMTPVSSPADRSSRPANPAPPMTNPTSANGPSQAPGVGLAAPAPEDPAPSTAVRPLLNSTATGGSHTVLNPSGEDSGNPTMPGPSGEHVGTDDVLPGRREPSAAHLTGQPRVPLDASRLAPRGDADSADSPPTRDSAGHAPQTPTDTMPRSAGTALTELAGHTERRAEPTQVEVPPLQVEQATRAGTTEGTDRQSPTATRPTALPSTTLAALQDMRRSGDARRRIVVRLDPPDLGSVTIELTAVGDDIHIAARAESAEAVRAILRQHGEMLSALQTQGLSLTEFDVQAEADDPTDRHRALRPNGSGGETAGETTDDKRGLPATDEGAIFL